VSLPGRDIRVNDLALYEPKGGFIMTEKDVIQYEVAGGIATIWLNRPHKRNCVSPQLLDDLAKAVDRAEADEEARAGVAQEH
jgi:enoyl-CoA hydratase/carnithine racemase